MAKTKKIVKPKKITKAKEKSMARTAKRKLWKETADAVRSRDKNVCVVCGQPHDKLNVHHLIPREIKEYWLSPMNLITLCPKHHKFSFTESFHKSPFFGVEWIRKNRPDQYQWIIERITIT